MRQFSNRFFSRINANGTANLETGDRCGFECLKRGGTGAGRDLHLLKIFNYFKLGNISCFGRPAAGGTPNQAQESKKGCALEDEYMRMRERSPICFQEYLRFVAKQHMEHFFLRQHLLRMISNGGAIKHLQPVFTFMTPPYPY